MTCARSSRDGSRRISRPPDPTTPTCERVVTGCVAGNSKTSFSISHQEIMLLQVDPLRRRETRSVAGVGDQVLAIRLTRSESMFRRMLTPVSHLLWLFSKLAPLRGVIGTYRPNQP